MTQQEKLEEALKPFALYGKHLANNPMMQYINKDLKLVGLPFAPTIADFERAASLVDADYPERPDIAKMRQQTTGKVSNR